MYECPNCGGNLKFDIPSQQLACAYCGTHLDPYSVKKETDAIETDYFEATIFTCPQCGGELFSTDNEAASFCTFCGASTILSSRISREKRPDFIVPFQKTKEDCKKAYEQKMRKAFFLPKELRDSKFIDGFRGIYMPYWTYQLIQKGNVSIPGENSTRKGDYVYTDHYNLQGNLDAYYLGYSYDASSSFYDNISEALAPYDAKKLVHFTPAFLSGFYADTADISSEVYLAEAKEKAEENTYRWMKEEPAFKSYSIPARKKNTPPEKGFHTWLRKADNTMYPVWFLSYRNKDRVAYAAVNGQTGKVVADMPVEPKRYLAASLILAVPLFILLNLLFTLRPKVLLGIAMILLFGAALTYLKELNAIFRKEHNLDDKALNWKKSQSGMPGEAEYEKEAGGKKTDAPDASKQGRKKNVVLRLTIYILACMCLPVLIAFITVFFHVGSLWDFVLIVCWSASAVGTVISGSRGIRREKELKNGKSSPGFVVAMVVAVAGALVGLANPVSDIYYYGGAIFALAAVLFLFVDIIGNYNKLATRRLPQFDKKGGDDRA
ncbi:MAG: hypothetical protein NC429_15185 [Lachnospiraceae bacterium]|nr:hypothetical protein [Lachnospiraceae bacterium]